MWTPFSFFGKVKSTRKRWWSDSRCWLDCCFYTQKRFSDVPRVSCRANTIAVTVCQSQSQSRLQWTKSVTVAVTTKAKDRCTPQSQSHTVEIKSLPADQCTHQIIQRDDVALETLNFCEKFLQGRKTFRYNNSIFWEKNPGTGDFECYEKILI